MKKIHLKYGISIPYRQWTRARDATTASKFVRRLALELWTREKLLQKALQTQRTQDPNDRTQLTPKKEAVLGRRFFFKRLLDSYIFVGASNLFRGFVQPNSKLFGLTNIFVRLVKNNVV